MALVQAQKLSVTPDLITVETPSFKPPKPPIIILPTDDTGKRKKKKTALDELMGTGYRYRRHRVPRMEDLLKI